jgi:hypothetical protein
VTKTFANRKFTSDLARQMIFLVEIIGTHPLGHEFQSGQVFQRHFYMEEEYLSGHCQEHTYSDYI